MHMHMHKNTAFHTDRTNTSYRLLNVLLEWRAESMEIFVLPPSGAEFFYFPRVSLPPRGVGSVFAPPLLPQLLLRSSFCCDVLCVSVCQCAMCGKCHAGVGKNIYGSLTGGGGGPTQSQSFFSSRPSSQGGLCYNFLKSPRKGRFGKVWGMVG